MPGDIGQQFAELCLVSGAVAWAVNPEHNGGIEHWVSIHKVGMPNCPFAYMHEDEAERVVAIHNALLDSALKAAGITGS